MRIYRLVSTAFGGVLMAGMSSAAFAACGGGVCSANVRPNILPYEGVSCSRPVMQAPAYRGATPRVNCAPAAVNVQPGGADPLAPVNVYNTAPFGHLNYVQYKNTPNVNVMRVHSRAPAVKLSDAPTSFSRGCNSVSSGYCRSGAGTPVRVTLNPRPVIAAPLPMPVRVAPSYQADLTPRQYGSTAFVPGIAHVPTSIVDRSPITHIDGVPQPRISSVTTAPAMRPAPMPMAHRPAPHGNVIGQVNAGSYTYQPPGGGAYWEKTSGPTMVDGLPATQILCRRQAPRPAPVTVNVVRPVIGVPHPVPTAVPVRVAPVCAPAPHAAMRAPVMRQPAMAGGNSRYGSRWSY